MRYTGLVDHYRHRLPIADDAPAISLGEGRTPLIKLENIPRDLGLNNEIYVKFEGLNPTGSFKDRGMTVAVTQAVHEGAKAIICASTGNTSASAAAYAVRAGVTAFVLIPEGKIAMGKLAQAIVHGAIVVQIQGNFDDGMQIVKEIGESAPVAVVNSINPYRIQGQKTIAFEVVEDLGQAPDYHCLPVGNAGNITAHWIGYSDAAGVATQANVLADSGQWPSAGAGPLLADLARPVMVGYQASGAAPFLRGEPVSQPETVATAIRIGNPQSWDLAWLASKESGGWFDECTDQAILETQRLLAAREGIFCEPASAASLCGAIRDIRNGKIPAGKTIVCTLTGNGLKDTDVVMQDGLKGLIKVSAERDAVAKVLTAHL